MGPYGENKKVTGFKYTRGLTHSNSSLKNQEKQRRGGSGRRWEMVGETGQDVIYKRRKKMKRNKIKSRGSVGMHSTVP